MPLEAIILGVITTGAPRMSVSRVEDGARRIDSRYRWTTITPEDVMELGREFWRLTATHAPLEKIEPLFVNPTILIPNGELRSLAAHQAMHRGFRDQVHDWRDLIVTPICDDPERVQAVGSVTWEASFTSGRPGRIKSVVGETWIIERCPDGALRWTFDWSDSIEIDSGSASFDP